MNHPDPAAILRDRIAAALLARIKRATVSKSQPFDAFTSLLAATEYDLADAVLAVLPEPADRALLLRAADHLTRSADQLWPGGGSVMHADAAVLRRLADEAPEPADRAAVRAEAFEEAADHAYRIARRRDDQHLDERAQGAWDVENTLRAQARLAAGTRQSESEALRAYFPEWNAAADAIEKWQHERDDETAERLGGLDAQAEAAHIAVHRAAAELRRLADEQPTQNEAEEA